MRFRGRVVGLAYASCGKELAGPAWVAAGLDGQDAELTVVGSVDHVESTSTSSSARLVQTEHSILAHPSANRAHGDNRKLLLNREALRAKGKKMLICFFDMNKRPSRNCLLQLDARTEERETHGIAVAAIHASAIDEEKLNLWVDKYGITLPIGMVQEDAEKIMLDWGVESLPWLILTDSEHTVLAEGFSLSELSEKIEQQ